MGVRRGGQEGSLAHPPPAPPPPLGWPKQYVFLTFLKENAMFLGIFYANSMFLPPSPPWKSLPPLEKKFVDAHD